MNVYFIEERKKIKHQNQKDEN